MFLVLSSLAAAEDLRTKWASGVNATNVHREYPRPQMVRKEWLNLNGQWDFAITGDEQPPKRFTKKILVPFPVESQLSGIQTEVGPKDTIWYRRQFARPKGECVLLHFGASDWETKVWINGKSVGKHRGGYDPFTFDITDALTQSGQQTILISVTDPTDSSVQPRGKQVLNPQGIFYTSTSGIWQTVWLEPVPKTSISSLKIETWPRAAQVEVTASLHGPSKGITCLAETIEGTKVLARSETKGNGVNVMKVAGAKNWSPEDPHLYKLRLTLRDKDKKVIDKVDSYFGFREVELGKDENGQPRILLNSKPYFMIGPLDQGFWPDGLYTAPSDEALRYDLEVTTRLGFNMVRKHVKVEPDRWYYWCDVLGLVVFQDMPSGDKSIGGNDPDITRTPESASIFKNELKAMVDSLHNHPSIITWVLYNEGWGQWDTLGMTKWLKDYDKRRLVDSTTGWADRGTGDFSDVHSYPGPAAPRKDENRALLLGEFGGLGLVVPGHTWRKDGWGYQTYKTKEELTNAFVALLEKLQFLKSLSGAVYTQTTDVETELNGLMTYDRALIKMDEARVKTAIEKLRSSHR